MRVRGRSGSVRPQHELVAAQADVLQVHRAVVGKPGQPLHHEQRRAGRGLQHGGGVRVRADGLDSDAGATEPVDRAGLDQREDVVVGQVLAEQRPTDIGGQVCEVEGERQAVQPRSRSM